MQHINFHEKSGISGFFLKVSNFYCSSFLFINHLKMQFTFLCHYCCTEQDFNRSLILFIFLRKSVFFQIITSNCFLVVKYESTRQVVNTLIVPKCFQAAYTTQCSRCPKLWPKLYKMIKNDPKLL